MVEWRQASQIVFVCNVWPKHVDAENQALTSGETWTRGCDVFRALNALLLSLYRNVNIVF